MKHSISPFNSLYIIDGVQMDNTPEQLLSDCLSDFPFQNTEIIQNSETIQNAGTIVDEIVDPAPSSTKYDISRIKEYAAAVSLLIRKGKTVENVCLYPGSYTRRIIADSLISSLWKPCHFSIEDIGLELIWKWNSQPVGNMAAFYLSVDAAAAYLFRLSVRLIRYDFIDTNLNSNDNANVVRIEAATLINGTKNTLSNNGGTTLGLVNDGGTTLGHVETKCSPYLLTDDESDWLIYVPFDTCDFKLGGSVFENAAGTSGEAAPDISDSDYFADCFEVIRELVEDGVVVAGTNVGIGGLVYAVSAMCKDGGIDIDISGIESACSKTFRPIQNASSNYVPNAIKILFSEVPGVLIQIRDYDYDYVDSQMILQDLAYYPLGHPDKNLSGVNIVSGKRSTVSDILSALIRVQTSEGED